MGRYSCCWCLFILLVLVVIVTNRGNAKKNSEQKRQKKEQIKSSEGAESAARNKQQTGKKKGETKPSEKTERRRNKVKKKHYSTSFDPNWACKTEPGEELLLRFRLRWAWCEYLTVWGLWGIPHTLDWTGRVAGIRRGTTASVPASLGTMWVPCQRRILRRSKFLNFMHFFFFWIFGKSYVGVSPLRRTLDQPLPWRGWGVLRFLRRCIQNPKGATYFQGPLHKKKKIYQFWANSLYVHHIS